MELEQYLSRIGINETAPPTYSFLVRLQWQHLRTVPFENLDILRDQPIILEEARLYDKIVHRHRGGFCYELNGLFAWLLRGLGFSVSMLSARVFRSSLGHFSPEFDHMALLVHLGRAFLVDVGFGDFAHQPIALPDGSVEDLNGTYRVRSSAADEASHLVQRKRQDRWQPVYAFTTQSRALSDFQRRCDYHQTAPSSHFRQGTICSLATETGRLSLTDDAWIRTEHGTKVVTAITAPGTYEELLSRCFGIRLGDPGMI